MSRNLIFNSFDRPYSKIQDLGLIGLKVANLINREKSEFCRSLFAFKISLISIACGEMQPLSSLETKLNLTKKDIYNMDYEIYTQ